MNSSILLNNKGRLPALIAAFELSAKEFNNILRRVIAETAPVWASIVSTGFLVFPKISSTIFLLSPFKKEISNSFEPALWAKLFPVKKSGSLTSASVSKFLGAFAVAAILTPPDPITQIGLGIPLLILYELSILSVKIIEKKK